MKRIVESLPEPIGRIVALVPFEVRFGWPYVQACRMISAHAALDRDAQRDWMFHRLKGIVSYAYEHSRFYRGHFEGAGFHPDHLGSLDDIVRIPIVSKQILRAQSLESRCSAKWSGYPLNTGGTSGEPLGFAVDSDAFAREWAHMLRIWTARGYRRSHAKLTFRGAQFGDRVIRYNPVHNEYIVSATASPSLVLEAVEYLLKRRRIFWLHGYPSRLAEFCQGLKEGAPKVADRLSGMLLGALLGSEYPAPVYRRAIEGVAGDNLVSWYGHSEMAVLAPEAAEGEYVSMPTYGISEGVSMDGSGGASALIATSLHNRSHPFIRYDTGDVIECLNAEPEKFRFRIVEGRIGDFIVDKVGNRISLTAVIFGRHHPAFEALSHVQVSQQGQGRASLHVVPGPGAGSHHEWLGGFDLRGIDMDWTIQVMQAPVRSPGGKILLKIPSEVVK